MQSIYARTSVRIWGTKNAWSASQTGGPDQPSRLCTVELEIQGDGHDGFHLVMSPSGFFTADSWHPTKQDALDAALEVFDIDQSEWSNTPPSK